MGTLKDHPPLIAGKGTPEHDWRRWLTAQQFPTPALAELLPGKGRVVIIAPHPDDEVLGCGGLLAMLAKTTRKVLLIAVTDGEASHPRSTQWPAKVLSKSRVQETREAMQALGWHQPNIIRAGLNDGRLAMQKEMLRDYLSVRLRPDDILVCPWRHDGHPDHDAVGEVCAALAAHSGMRLLEMPIWAWHWAEPGDTRLPWQNAVTLQLPVEAAGMKQRAIYMFRSQLEPDPSTQQPPILPAHVLERFRRFSETYLVS